MRALALWSTLLVPPSVQPVPERPNAREIEELSKRADVRLVPVLEEIFERAIGETTRFPERLFPRDLEAELVASLRALARLDAPVALEASRLVLRRLSEATEPVWIAREIVGRSGDLAMLRSALRRYFEAPSRWGRVLGEAAHATGDVRLRDFEHLAAPAPPISDRIHRTRLEATLDASEGTSALPRGRTPRELATPLSEEDRARALRLLVERDDPALLELPPSGREIDRLHPYLALSRHRSLRDSLHRAEAARGRSLASLLLSPRVNEEERREHLEAMRDAWAGALVHGGERVLSSFDKETLARWILREEATEDFVEALAIVPSSEARERLERLATASAIRALMERRDRVRSVPALTKLRRHDDPSVRSEAERALLRLGAAGSTVFPRTVLERDIDSLLPALFDSPAEGRVLRDVVVRAASRAGASPHGLAALTALRERHPPVFSELLGSQGPLGVRMQFVMSLSGDERYIPLLIDEATRGRSEAERKSAFMGLAEIDLGPFEKRLHRFAGDPDRRTRFLTGAALVPYGESWTLRLLLAELDEADPWERYRARRALERLSKADARDRLLALIEDGTASGFAIGIFLDVRLPADLESGRLRVRLWELLEEGVERNDRLALAAAARLGHPEAEAAVRRYLSGR